MTRFAGFAAIVVAVASSARAVDVGTCEEFAAVDRRTETEVTITSADFACDEYTRLTIRSDMVLKSTVGAVTFSNFALKVAGSLVVEPDVAFTNIDSVEKHGGALKLEIGSSAVFQGNAEFRDNSIISTDLGTIQLENGATQDREQTRKGGAIHIKGSMTFEKDATFLRNSNKGLESGSGPGGAISVQGKGTIHFMGKLSMTDNEGDDYFGGAEGGAIYNRGDIIVDGEADFTGNSGGRGGAIYQVGWASIIFNEFVTFTSNKCYDTYGAAVSNWGGDFTCKNGSLFFDGFAENSGDGGVGGGIYNRDGGVVTLQGSTTFRKNYGNYGGGIFNQIQPGIFDSAEDYKTPVITYPFDTVFEENYGQYCNDVAFDYDEDTCGL